VEDPGAQEDGQGQGTGGLRAVFELEGELHWHLGEDRVQVLVVKAPYAIHVTVRTEVERGDGTGVLAGATTATLAGELSVDVRAGPPGDGPRRRP